MKVEDGPDGLDRVTCNEHQTTFFKTKVYSRILALTPIPSPKNPRSTEDFRARGAHMFLVISCKVGFLKGDFSRHTKHINAAPPGAKPFSPSPEVDRA